MAVTVDRRRPFPLAPGVVLGIGLGGFVDGIVLHQVEGIIDHHVLGLHHVRENVANVLLWDLGFLVFGALLVAAGLALANTARETSTVELRRAA